MQFNPSHAALAIMDRNPDDDYDYGHSDDESVGSPLGEEVTPVLPGSLDDHVEDSQPEEPTPPMMEPDSQLFEDSQVEEPKPEPVVTEPNSQPVEPPASQPESPAFPDERDSESMELETSVAVEPIMPGPLTRQKLHTWHESRIAPASGDMPPPPPVTPAQIREQEKARKEILSKLAVLRSGVLGIKMEQTNPR